MNPSAKSALMPEKLDALAQNLRPSWDMLFGNGASADIVPPTPATRRAAQQPASTQARAPESRRRDDKPVSSRRKAASAPSPSIDLPTKKSPVGKIVLAIAGLAVVGIIIAVATSGPETAPARKDTTPAAEQKAPPKPTTPPAEEKAEEKAEPPAPPPEPEPAEVEPPAPPPAPKAVAPHPPFPRPMTKTAPKAQPTGKTSGKPQPKKGGIVREVPF